MTLHVPFAAFPDSVKRILRHREAYVNEEGGEVVVTASLPAEGVVVSTVAENASLEEAKEHLREAGMDVREGAWHLEEAQQRSTGRRPPYIAAVSYASGEGRPGVWVDAFETRPTQVQVLRAMYEEFRNTGELPEVSFDEFVRLALPSVAVVSPGELTRYIAEKRSPAAAQRAALLDPEPLEGSEESRSDSAADEKPFANRSDDHDRAGP